MARQFSKVKEVVAGWGQVRQYLRSGDNGHLVPVVIPRDRRGFQPLFWLGIALFLLIVASRAGNVELIGSTLRGLALLGTIFALFITCLLYTSDAADE